MFVSSFVLWVDVLSTKYLFFSMCSLNSKRCIISMCSTNQRVRERVSVALRSSRMNHGIHLSGQELFTHYLCRSDFQNNRKTSIYMRLHIVSTKKFIKYFKQQPPVLSLFCSEVQCSVTEWEVIPRSRNLKVTALFCFKTLFSTCLIWNFLNVL